jgi:glycosyltransferase involved in cell wall biosynthesis
MHNIEAVLYREMLATRADDPAFASVLAEDNVRRIEDAEAQAVEACDEVWTCSVDDAALLRRTYASVEAKSVRVVRDVVDVPDVPPLDTRPSRVVFTGRLDYYPNALAAEKLLLQVAPLLHPFEVVVAGAQPPESLTSLPMGSNCRVVPDPPDMDLIRHGGVLVVPLMLGGGSRFKIIEAFATGVPVVSSAKGIEGIQAEPGRHYLFAEEPKELAGSVHRLLDDDGLRARMVAEAWRLAGDHYSVPALARQLGEVMGRDG